jgi:hypothetical protein
MQTALSLALALVVPLAVAVAWIPLRTHLPNVDLALVLVAVVAGLGALGSGAAVIVASLSAALWFEFFDTVPYEHLAIARNPDVETTLILAVVALVAGELGVRTSRHGVFVRGEREKLSTIRDTAQLVASGEELVRVIGAVAHEMTGLLGLSECRFEAGDPDPTRAQLDRSGLLVPPARPVARAPGGCAAAELPVIVQGEHIGRFVMELDSRQAPSRDRLQVAVTLADNVGAAFLAQAPPPPPPDREPLLPLRLVAPLGRPAHPDAAGSGPAGDPGWSSRRRASSG